ncbi:hypothetical protein M433DRAFT_460490 [Acidomyces richmondensis BFW]|nr:MAG: hypothetical protein FE78DRAFT_257120 [Acidomyces sp. 'richmondensis']KYG47968.1 hypothetical protein M433DRAFT_460490 [Acidomyces richmondensis BFW]
MTVEAALNLERVALYSAFISGYHGSTKRESDFNKRKQCNVSAFYTYRMRSRFQMSCAIRLTSKPRIPTGQRELHLCLRERENSRILASGYPDLHPFAVVLYAICTHEFGVGVPFPQHHTRIWRHVSPAALIQMLAAIDLSSILKSTPVDYLPPQSCL